MISNWRETSGRGGDKTNGFFMQAYAEVVAPLLMQRPRAPARSTKPANAIPGTSLSV